MLRRLLALLIALGLGTATWLRSEVPPPSYAAKLALIPLPLGPQCCQAGPLRLLGAWQLLSPHAAFGGYSALLQPAPGQLLAISDRGYFLELPKPATPRHRPRFGAVIQDDIKGKTNRDFESATRDPATGQLWIGQEGRNAIERLRPDFDPEAVREVPEMQGWSRNSGAEAMVRLRDGRFIVLCECTGPTLGTDLHPGLLFQSDPALPAKPQRFDFSGVPGYRPTDMAQLPDGRVLILARRLLWPLPPRFAMKVLIADPADLRSGETWQAREVADFAAPWPVDNYEGLAIERLADGTLIAWIISDENSAASQRVLLLKVAIDESKL